MIKFEFCKKKNLNSLFNEQSFLIPLVLEIAYFPYRPTPVF